MFKPAIEEANPRSLVVIDYYTINENVRFRTLFFTLKACVDVLSEGCRSYLAVDSAFLPGKFKG